MSGYEKLGFKSKLPFGKHTGKTVHAVMHEMGDWGWLLWIRFQKAKQGETMFEDNVNVALDQMVAKKPKEYGKFAVDHDKAKPGGKAIPGVTTQPDRSEEYNEGWGAF